MRKFLDHYVTVIFTTILTVYALFFDDIRILAFNREYDDIFFGITAAGIVIFLIEIMLSSYAKP